MVFKKQGEISGRKLQWFQKISAVVVESRTEPYSTRCKFLCNLCCSAFVRQFNPGLHIRRDKLQ